MGGKSGGGAQTIGFRYYFGIHMGISRGPVNELVEIKVGAKSAWPTPASSAEPDDENSYDVNEAAFNKLVKITSQPNFSVNPYAPYVNESGYVVGDAEVIIYLKVPKSWSVGHAVKIDDFIRSDFDLETANPDYTKPYLDKSGIYLIVSRRDDSFSVKIDGATYQSWQLFGAAPMVKVTDQKVVTLTHVLDLAGTPVPPQPGDGSTDPVDSTVGDPGSGGVMGSTTIQLNAPNLFGGDKAEGGIVGPLVVMMGEPTQVAPPGLVTMLGEALPGFRRMFTVFYDGLISSMNPYPKTWKFRVRRSTQGWDGEVISPDLARIVMTRTMAAGEVTSSRQIHAMNGAHIIFECLTNREWGRGLPRTAINIPSFVECAATMYSENLGLCLRWNRSDSIESFVQSVLDHIGATLYQDAATSLLTLKLIRGGYVVSQTPLFDSSNGLLEITDAPVGSGGSYVNAVKVTYRDPITDEDRTVTVQNLASIQASGGAFNVVSKAYPGIPTPALANRIAQRDLQTLGLELRKFTLKLDRRASSVRPGDVIRVRDPSRSIRETLLRVASYEDGTIVGGAITVVGVQDVFSLPQVSYIDNQQSGWKPPTAKPCIGRHEVFEIPYVVLARTMAPADFDYVEEDAGYLGVVLEQGQPLNAAYDLAVAPGLPKPEDVPATSGSYCGYTPPST